MKTMKERTRGEEAKFAHDEEQKFVRSAGIAKRLGLWAARQKGLADEAETAFATEVQSMAINKGQDAVVAFLVEDLSVSEKDVRDQLALLSA